MAVQNSAEKAVYAYYKFIVLCKPVFKLAGKVLRECNLTRKFSGFSTGRLLPTILERSKTGSQRERDFQLDVYFQQFWRDPRLAHNESGRVLIRDKEMLGKMWHPDVYFANARIAEFHQVTQPNFLLWIEPDGSILYDTRISMVVVCTLNLEKWPLDSQRCHLRILSYAYTTDQLQIEWVEETPITRNMQIAMSDMHIVDLYPGYCDGNYSTGTWSCVTAEFFVKREVTHHVMQSYVPTTLIVVISWSVRSFFLLCIHSYKNNESEYQ
ncbi:unnamed protein product [Cylicostephanus goldi]|uniref:Neurotransmitter-gated ion-channel ligand-binding domain-containing protein n=1 Tax=Cylicostephanus goldi TaxID=71465 RepID=A0A3P7MXA7_CYLGO|nr:unnamed protein product [Cylicostephanus goldi]